MLLPTLGLTARRLRDAGDGWGQAFWTPAPVAGLIVLIVLCTQPSTAPAEARREDDITVRTRRF